MEGIYRPRHPEKTVLYRALFHYFKEFVAEYESRFEREYGSSFSISTARSIVLLAVLLFMPPRLYLLAIDIAVLSVILSFQDVSWWKLRKMVKDLEPVQKRNSYILSYYSRDPV